MKKVWKLAAISLLALTLTVSHAFLCSPVKAAASDPSYSLRVLFSFIENGSGDPLWETYLYCDLIFTSNALSTGTAKFQFTQPSGYQYSYGPVEGDGIYSATANSSTSPRIITINFANTTSWIYRIVIRSSSDKFSQATLNNPVNAFGISFNVSSITYGDVVYSDMYQYNLMNEYLESISEDVSGILTVVNEINQQISQDQQDKIDDVIDKNDDLNNLITDSNTIEQGITNQFANNKNQFNSSWNNHSSTINFYLNQWQNRLNLIKIEFESFIVDSAYYLPFIVLPVFLALFKRLMGG